MNININDPDFGVFLTKPNSPDSLIMYFESELEAKEYADYLNEAFEKADSPERAMVK